MTGPERAEDGAAGRRARRRWVRLLALLGIWAVAWGAVVVVLHLWIGESWGDAGSIGLVSAMSAVGGSWLGTVIRRKAGRGDG